MRFKRTWPERILIVRHGQSSGNVARDLAEAEGLHEIGIHLRDVDIPLSPLGERQAAALGRWFAKQPLSEQPTIILTSPYVRAQKTAELIKNELSDSLKIIYDERLREREFGLIDGLTKPGITDRFPLEAKSYAQLGKFYYRPPGGESWCDVILRLQSVSESLARDYVDQRVLIVCHTVVVLCFRYLIEQMTEADILKIDRENLVANCSLTSFCADENSVFGNGLSLDRFNFVAPLEEAGEKVTQKQDTPKT